MNSDDASHASIKTDFAHGGDVSTLVLNPLLRMAIITGVESAVSLHIQRGDNLNARDGAGLTPLMLCALRNKHRVCVLLLKAGSDSSLLSPQGKSAHQIALEKGYLQVAALLAPKDEEVRPEATIITAAQLPASYENKTIVVAEEPKADYTEFPDLDAWEADEEMAPPVEVPELAHGAARVHAEISLHVPEDSESSDWADIDAYLPETAAAPARLRDDDDVRSALRLLFLRALREGSVPAFGVEDVVGVLDPEGKDQLLPHLTRLIGDLGADTDERFEYKGADDNFEVYVSPEASEFEDDFVSDVLVRFDEILSRRNEPIRQYLRSMQHHALLDAEQEILLAREMEESLLEAIELVATDASAISHTLEVLKLVRVGRRSLTSISRGWADQEERSGDAAEQMHGSLKQHSSSDEPSDDGEDSNDESELLAFSDDERLLTLERALATYLETGVSREVKANVADHLKAFRPSVAFLCELSDRSVFALRGEGHASLREVLGRYQRARERMITSNLKLVFSLAKKYVYSGMPLDDLVQEGNIGLIKAVERYDWRKGFRFSTYATWWIRQGLSRSVADAGRTIRLPVYVHEKVQKLSWFIRKHEAIRGIRPSISEMAAELSIQPHKVGAMLSYMQDIASLDDVNRDWQADPSQLDRFCYADPEEFVAAGEDRRRINQWIQSLPRQQRNIISPRFGIGVSYELTLEEIGQRMGVTRERIRQIESKAMRMLKFNYPTRSKWLQGTGRPSGVSPDAQLATLISVDSDFQCISNGHQRGTDAVGAQPDTCALTSHESSHKLSPIEQALALAAKLGIEVQDERSNDLGRIWVRITSFSDVASYRLVKQLRTLGFQEEAGKGYWK